VLLGIICNRKKHLVDELQSVTHMYLKGVAEHMNVQPVLIPAPMKNGRFQPAPIMDRLDGILMTGSTSNVHPSRYRHEETEAHKPFDLARDDAAFQLFDIAIERDMPLLAICRGFQELNVACGGTLTPTVHEIDGRIDHRMPESDDVDVKFGVQHRVNFTQGGYLHGLLGAQDAAVNSLHWQAVDRLGDKLAIEAQAEDGTVEAVKHTEAEFCVGVQWHPEYQAGENIISAPLFGDFERAMKAYANG
jgi:putative glutamine amidotransferase